MKNVLYLNVIAIGKSGCYMNKYQEALNHLCKYEIAYKVSCKESIETLQELIDKYEKIKYPRLMPCKCGYNRRHVYYNTENGWDKKVITYECMKCHKKVSTQGSEPNAIKHWNEVMSND